MVGIIRDITVDWLAEQELRRARDAATEASAAKTRFLAAVSHDLTDPGPCRCSSNCLGNKPLAPDVRDLVGMIDVSVKAFRACSTVCSMRRASMPVSSSRWLSLTTDELLNRLAAEFEAQTSAMADVQAGDGGGIERSGAA